MGVVLKGINECNSATYLTSAIGNERSAKCPGVVGGMKLNAKVWVILCNYNNMICICILCMKNHKHAIKSAFIDIYCVYIYQRFMNSYGGLSSELAIGCDWAAVGTI